MTRFRVMTADPGWRLDDQLPGNTRGADKQYTTQPIEDIIARRGLSFEWPTLADDAILFMWRLSSMVEEAYQVMRAWDFAPKSEIVWCKLTKYERPHIGMGRTARLGHEVAIIGTRGDKYRNVVKNRGIRSVFSAPMPIIPDNHPDVLAGRVKKGSYWHSAKPAFFYTDIVEKMCHGPYVELFGRNLRPGWTVLGNEVPKEMLK